MKYNSIEELRRKKSLLKKDISEMEDLLTFKDKKESLSAITHGFTDRFLSEKTQADGSTKLSLKTANVVKEIGQSLTKKSEQKSILHFDNKGLEQNTLETAVKLGSVFLAGSLAKKNLNKSGWKNKLLGLAMVYFLPMIIKFIGKKIDEYQTKKSVSSIEKLI